MRRYLDGRSMDAVAIERIRFFEPQALAMHPGGYWLAFSGGKDSVVILDLAKRAGVRFEAHQSLCGGVDPPELVWFTKRYHPEVALDRAPKTMWRLIAENGIPPRRMARYCCRELKERGGPGRLVITGIRRQESNRRTNRRMTEACYQDSTRRFLHPIIDWSTADVWEYIRERGLPYCSLYDEGFARLGCVLCPMKSNPADVRRELDRWPIIARNWKRAIEATYRPEKVGPTFRFQSPQEYWNWWLFGRRESAAQDDQPVLFEDDPSLTGAAP